MWYEPSTWSVPKEAIEPLALAEFYNHFPAPQGTSDEAYAVWQADIQLGKQMLTDYFVMSKLKDDFTPVYVEIEFEVPIPWQFDWDYRPSIPDGFIVKANNTLHYLSAPVVYQGRIDLIVQDKYDKYWIWDHKTAASLGPTEHLEMDEQCGSYMWAIQQQLGIKIEGVVYNELVKKVPHKPKLIGVTEKKPQGSLSKDKQQDTTYALYLEAIAENNFSLTDYTEFLDYLQTNPKEFFRRTIVPRSQNELKILGDNIALEAIDMLNNPSIYPNPTKFNCNYCAFRTPCLNMMEGSDPTWILNDSFHIRTSNTEEAAQ